MEKHKDIKPYPCDDNVKVLADEINKGDKDRQKHLHCVLLYERESRLKVKRQRWDAFARRGNVLLFDSYDAAISYYCNTPCPASQMLHADTDEELHLLIKEMDDNMSNPEWVKEHIEPYL